MKSVGWLIEFQGKMHWLIVETDYYNCNDTLYNITRTDSIPFI